MVALGSRREGFSTLISLFFLALQRLKKSRKRLHDFLKGMGNNLER
jgi:lipid A disaccharide synthetase